MHSVGNCKMLQKFWLKDRVTWNVKKKRSHWLRISSCNGFTGCQQSSSWTEPNDMASTMICRQFCLFKRWQWTGVLTHSNSIVYLGLYNMGEEEHYLTVRSAVPSHVCLLNCSARRAFRRVSWNAQLEGHSHVCLLNCSARRAFRHVSWIVQLEGHSHVCLLNCSARRAFTRLSLELFS
jgi:hypothetical protein